MTFRVPDDWIERAFKVLLREGIVADCKADKEAVGAAVEAAYWPEAALALEAEAAKKGRRGK